MRPLSPLMTDEAEVRWKIRTHSGVMTLCKTPGRQTIATFFAPRGLLRDVFERRTSTGSELILF